MAGATVANYAGYYGEKGYPGAFYSPGSRSNAIGWFDSANQEFYLYGGSGYTDTTSFGTKKNHALAQKKIIYLKLNKMKCRETK